MQKRSILVLCLAMLMPAYGNTSSDGATRPAKGVVGRCLNDDQLARAVVSLSQQYPEAQAAQRVLRKSAKRSSACRHEIIAAVMKTMDKADLDISREQTDANLWREGATLLGDLRATESLDLLLSHITMTDGEWSSTMTHQPALEGIIRMGPVAIPKLQKLFQNQDWQTRHYAVYCLASIGGASAKRAIETAAPLETHQCVKRFMLASIKTIDVKHGGVKPDNGEWAKAFMCMS
jgi:hypothetical protein